MNDPPDSDPDAVKLDVNDVELTSQRDVSAPPPLPPETAAQQGSLPPRSLPPPAPKRPPVFYAAVAVAFALVGLVVGGVLSMTLRKPVDAPTKVFNVPTVDIDDRTDGGP